LNLWVQGPLGSGISGASTLLPAHKLPQAWLAMNQSPPDQTQIPQDRAQLRRQLRELRRALSPQQQRQASLSCLRQLMQYPKFIRSQHFGLYLANDGELDPAPIAQQLWKMNKFCYLPVLHPSRPRELWFVRYTPDTPLKPNRFGIGEPDPFRNQRLQAKFLDMVLLPLVGFDRNGGRLGMGGGFYDKTFAFKKDKPEGKPYLIGLAHSIQEVPALGLADWDIPLSGVATEHELI
jgi:5-formyltetrahydrofolate cyclo-ligase